MPARSWSLDPAKPITVPTLKNSADESLQKAKTCDVELSKRNFFIKVLTFAVAGVSLAATALLTGITGGAGLPLLILTGINFGLATGDLICAGKDWHSKAHGGTGLAKGGDILGNTIYWLAEKCGAKPETADKIAIWGATIFRTAVIIGTAILGNISPVTAPTSFHTFSQVTSLVTSGLSAAINLVSGSSSQYATEQDQHRTKATEILIAAAIEQDRKNEDEQEETSIINTITEALMADNARLRAVIQELTREKERRPLLEV